MQCPQRCIRQSVWVHMNSACLLWARHVEACTFLEVLEEGVRDWELTAFLREVLGSGKGLPSHSSLLLLLLFDLRLAALFSNRLVSPLGRTVGRLLVALLPFGEDFLCHRLGLTSFSPDSVLFVLAFHSTNRVLDWRSF